VSITPGVSTSVVLRDEYGAEYRSNVIDLTEDLIVLRQPPDLTAVEPDDRMLVVWLDRTAMWVLPVVVAPLDNGRLQAITAGKPWREERRQHLRAVVDAAVAVTYSDGNHQFTADGLVIEMSEAALRFAVEREHVGLRVPQAPVMVELTFPSDQFTLSGHVLTGKPAGRPDLRLEVVVLFDRPVVRIEELRRYLAG
jgi:hypothetical protein